MVIPFLFNLIKCEFRAGMGYLKTSSNATQISGCMVDLWNFNRKQITFFGSFFFSIFHMAEDEFFSSRSSIKAIIYLWFNWHETWVWVSTHVVSGWDSRIAPHENYFENCKHAFTKWCLSFSQSTYRRFNSINIQCIMESFFFSYDENDEWNDYCNYVPK